MLVFKTKTFARFSRREGISDSSLIDAVNRAENGLVDVDLGGGVIKQRVARTGEGRSGGYRTLIAYRVGDRAFFLFGFAKNERDNINDRELATLQLIGSQWLTDRENVAEDVAIGVLIEVKI